MNAQTHELKMPAFGADMATGTLIEWQVKEGDSVRRGDVIAVIETSKGAIELDIFEDTVIEKLLVQVDDEVQVGTRIALLRGEAPEDTANKEMDALSTDSLSTKETLEAGEAEEVPVPITHVPITHLSGSLSDSLSDSFVPATPAARRLASERGISLSILAEQKGGPVTLKDIAPVKEERQRKKSGPEDEKRMMREAVSATVTLSKQTIPHYYLSHRLDITRLKTYISDYNGDKEPEERVLMAAPLLTAVARLLIKHSALNGQFLQGSFVSSDTVHLAHAVNIRGTGLIMPVIRDAQQYDAVSMMRIITRQISEARRGRLPMSQLTGATCCVSSIGERGAEQMSAIIQPPQVGIVTLGSPHQDAMVVNGEVEVRDVVIAGLSADHRVSDGHTGAKFLYQLNKLIQEPEALWTESNYTS